MFQTRAAQPKPLPQFPHHPPPARPPGLPAHAGWMQHARRLRGVRKRVPPKVVPARELRREPRVSGEGRALARAKRLCAARHVLARHMRARHVQPKSLSLAHGAQEQGGDYAEHQPACCVHISMLLREKGNGQAHVARAPSSMHARVYKTATRTTGMRARTALASLCAACACTATALAFTLPCRFFEYRAADTSCISCTAHTFGTPAHCAQYNETLPWANATSEFERRQLVALSHECERYADASTNSRPAGEPIVHLCDHLGADGTLAQTVVLAPVGGAHAEYTSTLPRTPISCPQGFFRANDTSCLPCRNNTTTNAGNKTSELDCEWCELGFRWRPQTRTCSRCPECYTTRPDQQPTHPDADYTRAEHCSPCSVWADDYRRGGCNATIAGQCVLHVPYADVHEVHLKPAPDAYNESWRGVFCSYEVWRNAAEIHDDPTRTNVQIQKCQMGGLVPTPVDSCKQVDMYVYEAETQKVHALFRPQSREHLLNWSEAYAATSAAYAEMPPGVRDFTYTTGTALPGAFDSLWQSYFADKDPYEYRPETGVVPPPFELSGSYTYPMHSVSVGTAPYYDFARAYHEHWLLGMLRPSQQACEPGNLQAYDECTRNRLQQYGILLCGNDATKKHQIADTQCADDPMCDMLGIFCKEVLETAEEPFCDSPGESAKVWNALQFYLYNATEQYAKMEQNVKLWEETTSNRTQAEPAESTACDRTHVDVSVLVTNTDSSAPATLYEIRARNPGDNETLYELELTQALAPPLLAFQHNFTVQVAVGSSIQVEVIASSGPHLQVQVRHAGVDLNTTSTQSAYDVQGGYTICLEHRDEDLVQVRTPADFAHMHTFLRAQLCDYA